MKDLKEVGKMFKLRVWFAFQRESWSSTARSQSLYAPISFLIPGIIPRPNRRRSVTVALSDCCARLLLLGRPLPVLLGASSALPIVVGIAIVGVTVIGLLTITTSVSVIICVAASLRTAGGSCSAGRGTSVALSCITVSKFLIDKIMTSRTLLRRAGAHTQGSIATICGVCTGVELLVAAPLQSSSNVHEGVALHLKWAIGVSRILNGSSGDTAERCSKGLEVASSLTALSRWRGGRTECGCDERCDDECGLHFENLR